jgi:glycosyltransferase involved in cell wall biosynthesis
VRIIQLLPSLSSRDAIGNDALSIDEILRSAGYEAQIMASSVDESLETRASEVDFASVTSDDLVILHSATGDLLINPMSKLACRKGLIYHNMTPARFFAPYNPVMAALLSLGRLQLRRYVPHMDFAWGVSCYNCRELLRYGVDESHLAQLPIIFGQKSTVPPDPVLAERLANHPGTKLLFVGRIVSNKKQEDIIKVYWHVLQDDPLATLYLVGNWRGMEKYYAKLKGFCADLHLGDDQVVFAGSVSDAEKEAYLAGCDALVCMSEHEGFCVPLIEAMRHDLPVLAYAAAAVPETLGNNGLLYAHKHFRAMAEGIERLKFDPAFREQVLSCQRAQLAAYEAQDPQEILLKLVERELAARGR